MVRAACFLPSPNMVQASWRMSGKLQSFFQSCQPDSRPAKGIDFSRFTVLTARGRMGTSVEDAVTFKHDTHIKSVWVFEGVFIFLSLYMCLYLCSPSGHI